jgi:general secretion pathway protein H
VTGALAVCSTAGPTLQKSTPAGFTLIEMLVVLMTMGILLGLISVSMAPGERDLLRLEAERLAQVLDLAADEARVSGKSIAWTSEEDGYRFTRRGPSSEWVDIHDNDLLRPRKLAPGILISELRVEAMRVQDARRIEFAPGGAMLAFNIALSMGAEHYSVAASPVGDVRVSSGKGKTYAEMAPN